MHPPLKDSVSLGGSSRERFGVVLQSLRGAIFGGHGFFEKDVVWT